MEDNFLIVILMMLQCFMLVSLCLLATDICKMLGNFEKKVEEKEFMREFKCEGTE